MTRAAFGMMIAATVLAGAGSGHARQRTVEIEQQSAGAASPPVEAAQISTDASASSRVAQIPPAEDQSRSRAALPDPQVARSPRTARELQPLSVPKEGRTGYTENANGVDRCAPGGAPLPGLCDRVIEDRAADFPRSSQPVLSAEQRLLVDQRLREAPSMDRIVRSGLAASNAGDANDAQVQAIASVALNGSDAPDAADQPPGTPLPSAPDAVLEAIINPGVTPGG